MNGVFCKYDSVIIIQASHLLLLLHIIEVIIFLFYLVIVCCLYRNFRFIVSLNLDEIALFKKIIPFCQEKKMIPE